MGDCIKKATATSVEVQWLSKSSLTIDFIMQIHRNKT